MSDATLELFRHAPCLIRENVPLAPLTTFRVGGPARLLAEPRNEAELVELMRIISKTGLQYFYLGLGSNLLVSDDGFSGVVIRSSGVLSKVCRDGEYLVSGPATRLQLLASFAAQNELSGLEQLSGIPGSVGGGLWMNAGAYGREISDVFEDATVLTQDLSLERISRTEISFSYRKAPELEPVIVLNSRYKLTKGDQSSITAEMKRVWMLRRAKQPIEYPSAGSIFKRPPGGFAGRLIEEAGCKELREGGAVVPSKHAGIFINDRGATAKEIASLVRTVRRRVYEMFNILLETEILPVGFESDPFEI